MSKVTLSKEIAEAIKDVRRFYRDAEIIMEVILDEGRSVYVTQMDVLIKEYRSKGKDFLETLITALVNGYEVEKTPEDNLREYYGRIQDDIDRYDYGMSLIEAEAKRCVVNDVLRILGITIEGINEKEAK